MTERNNYFKRKKEKKESPTFIIEDFQKQVYDEKYDLQGGDFLAYPSGLELVFSKSETIPLISFYDFLFI